MARIKPPQLEDVEPVAQKRLERFQQERGNIPNTFLTLAHRPEIMKTMADHMDAAFHTGTVNLKLKELIAIRVSQINACDCCVASHTALAKQMGIPETLLEALYHIDEHRNEFTSEELAAIHFAEVMTTDAREIDIDMWDELCEYFDDGQIIEIAAIVGIFNYFNRFNSALDIQYTR